MHVYNAQLFYVIKEMFDLNAKCCINSHEREERLTLNTEKERSKQQRTRLTGNDWRASHILRAHWYESLEKDRGKSNMHLV